MAVAEHDRVAAAVEQVMDAARAAGSSPAQMRERITQLVEGEVARERQRCVRLCLGRAALWEGTAAAQDTSPAVGREEARARGNEAEYVASLIDSDPEDLPDNLRSQ